MPGIQVHAAVADDILSNRFMFPESPRVTTGVVLLMALVAGVAATMVPAWWATMVTAVAVAALLLLSMRLFGQGYWLNISQPCWHHHWRSSAAWATSISWRAGKSGR
jgi:CHASE2 domain-containing sensor protein